MIYPKDIEENKRYRLNLLKKARSDNHVKNLINDKCKEDPLFFFNTLGWTYNPKKEPFDFPFITYPFQDKFILDVIKNIEYGEDNITEKSREMGFSWMLAGIQLWAFLFKGYSSLYGSYKETYVDDSGNLDSHFERIRYIKSFLPKWIIPKDIQDKYMSISSKTLGAEIGGDSGQNFGTGGRRKFIIMDEFALWQFADKAFRKTRDISGCRILGGTPEGRFNLYGKIMTDHKDYKHLNINKYRLHWKLHPDKTEEWYENEKKNRTSLDIAKELDISYDDSVTGAVYKDYSNVVQFGNYEYNPNYKLYTAWDFGRDMTAVIWALHNLDDDYCEIIDAYQKSAYDYQGSLYIDFFRAFITGEVEQGYIYTKEELEMIDRHRAWQNKYSGHFGDPYNTDSKTINAKSSIHDSFNAKGIYITTNRLSKLDERINCTKLFFRKLRVNENLSSFNQAIIQSRYPSVREGSERTTETLKPIHDDNSHFRTALEYLADNFPKLEHKPQFQRPVNTPSRGAFLKNTNKLTRGIL